MSIGYSQAELRVFKVIIGCADKTYFRRPGHILSVNNHGFLEPTAWSYYKHNKQLYNCMSLINLP